MSQNGGNTWMMQHAAQAAYEAHCCTLHRYWIDIALQNPSQSRDTQALEICISVDEPVRVDHTILEHCTKMQVGGTSVNIMLIGQTSSFTQLQEQRHCKFSDRFARALLRVVPSEG